MSSIPLEKPLTNALGGNPTINLLNPICSISNKDTLPCCRITDRSSDPAADPLLVSSGRHLDTQCFLFPGSARALATHKLPNRHLTVRNATFPEYARVCTCKIQQLSIIARLGPAGQQDSQIDLDSRISTLDIEGYIIIKTTKSLLHMTLHLLALGGIAKSNLFTGTTFRVKHNSVL